MAPQKSTSVRLKARPTLVPFKDDTSLIAVRYEKTVQAEPPIPILTRLPRRSLSISTRRTCRSATSSLPSPPISPVVVTPPPAIEQHPAFRPRVPAADNDWKRDSGLAPTASSGATIVEECEDQDHAYDKIDALIVAGHVVQRQKLVTPSICDSESFYSTEDPSVAKRPSAGRCTRTAAQMSIAMDHYHLAQLQIAERKLSGSFSSTLSVESPVELRDKSLADLSPATQPMITPARGSSFTASDKSPNLSPVNIPDDFNLLSKDATDFSPISISIPTVSLLDDDFLTTLSFSNRGSIMFGGRRAFPAQTTDGTMEAKSQTDDVHAPAPASPPTPASEPAPPILHIKYEEPLQSAVASMREPFANEAASNEPRPNEVPSSEAPMMEPTESNAHSAPELNAAEVIDASAAETMTGTTIEATTADPSAAQTTVDSTSQAAMKTPSIRVLSADVELESRKGRRAPTSRMGYSKIWKFIFPTSRNKKRI
ncbi:hypothetical protein CGMCC3_g10943 [Colletotrichum fructicola]|uniref:Uncharacterized protein n=1 Tax=Colletotrichum fructicola (strain Nara gc5) TaxID=1213859 RepID=A0A7J6J0T4_COLFN|nr:uncharacterized protein CGMCC3_g10943 [Colletotrichum fructicola]KAE9573156.1 hypothetical protein CGMCC3_g10943 [Colletotrichum fructicola]KAF4483124.1 hypothetical protein CGGC5_v008996 [Colletotrichum fructicola Nara gc5]